MRNFDSPELREWQADRAAAYLQRTLEEVAQTPVLQLRGRDGTRRFELPLAPDTGTELLGRIHDLMRGHASWGASTDVDGSTVLWVEIPRAWPVADPADSGRYTCAQLFAEEMTDIAGTDRLVHTGLACLRLGDRVDSLVTDGHHGRRALDLLDQGNFPQWPGPVLETKSDRIHFLVQTAPPPRAPSPQALLRHLGPGAWLWCPDSGDDNRTWWLRAPQPDDTGRARLGAAGPVLQALADSGRPMGFGQRLLSTS